MGERSAAEAKRATMTMTRRDEGRKIGKERKETYSVQLSTRKLVDLVGVHGETVDDGAGYDFDTRLDHCCAILIKGNNVT